MCNLKRKKNAQSYGNNIKKVCKLFHEVIPSYPIISFNVSFQMIMIIDSWSLIAGNNIVKVVTLK